MIIYMIRHKKIGMIYIGKTKRALKIRINEHLYNSRSHRSNSYIDNAIGKYGIEAFDILVVEECKTPEELNERERYWIVYFNCKYPNGYNLTDGGDGVSGRPMPPEHRAKLSKANKGKKRSKETRKRMSETQMGHEVTNETRAVLSANSSLKCPVRCIETGAIFDSITAASKWAGVTVNAISIALRGKTKKSGGFHWEYI